MSLPPVIFKKRLIPLGLQISRYMYRVHGNALRLRRRGVMSNINKDRPATCHQGKPEHF